MDTATEIIELKFDGNGIKPSKVKASEIAELIISYETAITTIIREDHPEVNDEYIFLSFEEVTECCLSLKFLPHLATKYVYPALLLITTAFETNDFAGLSNQSIQDLRQITRFAKKYNCTGTFVHNGVSVATFQPDIDVAYNDAQTLKGATTIYGEVKGVREKVNTIATILINDNYPISFEVTKAIGKQLAAQIFSNVGLRGTAKWEKRTYKIIDFKVDEVIILEDKSINETFIELGKLMGNDIDKFGDYINYLA